MKILVITIALISILASCTENSYEQFRDADKGFNIAEDSLEFYLQNFNGEDTTALNYAGEKVSYFENSADSCLRLQDSLLKLKQ